MDDEAPNAHHVAATDIAPKIVKCSNITVQFTCNTDALTGELAGIELRDLYGRLVFAFQETVSGRMRYSTSGLAVDADGVGMPGAVNGEPVWNDVALPTRGTCTISINADFAKSSLSCRITDASGAELLTGQTHTTATSLAAVYTLGGATDSSHHPFANFIVHTMGPQPDTSLQGKTIYAFGDSLIDGHMYTKAGFVTFAARQEGMIAINKARNGATVTKHNDRGQIIEQLGQIDARSASPDFIVFDGGTNDIYIRTKGDHSEIGTIVRSNDPASFDRGTFAGCFEYTLSRFRQRWPHAGIIYVAAGKLGQFDMTWQQAYRSIALQACEKWDVEVADVFGTTSLDTRQNVQKAMYSFDSLGSTGLPASYADNISQDSVPSGIHPNLAAIERFYVPTLLRAIRRQWKNQCGMTSM